MASEFFHDDEFGEVEIRYVASARKYILRCIKGKVVLTLPRKRDRELGIQFLNDSRDFCRKMLPKSKRTDSESFFDENTNWKSLTFSLKIVPYDCSKYSYNLKDGVLYFYYPKDVNVCTEKFQSIVKKLLTNVLLCEAKIFLPSRLKMWAEKYGFVYNSCVIKNISSRWGSCSSKKNINLSLFLMKLPIELVDYVLLHELCHLKEMNHGPQFWDLLDSFTEGKAKNLRARLKKYSPVV